MPNAQNNNVDNTNSPKPCGLDGSTDRYPSGGCRQCVRRWQREHPEAMLAARKRHALKNRKPLPSPLRRWESMVCKSTTAGGCWVWLAAKQNGVGIFNVGGKSVFARRWAWQQLVASVPPAHAVVASAGCERSCVNPAHMHCVLQSETQHGWVRGS